MNVKKMERSFALPPNRSISLPSRLHPTSFRVDAELNKLRTWEIKSCSSPETLTAETIQTGLVGLSEVYRCVEELVYTSYTKNGKVLEDALNHSVKLLDTCGIVRDTQQKMKEQALCLQSSLRKRDTESRFEYVVLSYLKLKKKLKKQASRCNRSLKNAERKLIIRVPSLEDYHLAMVVKVLREVNLMTSRILRSLLLFLSSAGTIKNRRDGCYLISKLMPSGKAKKIVNEVGSVDDALFSVLRGSEDMTMAHRKLENLVICLDCIEAGLIVVFRQLIQYRVSILNVLTR